MKGIAILFLVVFALNCVTTAKIHKGSSKYTEEDVLVNILKEKNRKSRVFKLINKIEGSNCDNGSKSINRWA